jgi:ketosteroid isomerase-like protein
LALKTSCHKKVSHLTMQFLKHPIGVSFIFDERPSLCPQCYSVTVTADSEKSRNRWANDESRSNAPWEKQMKKQLLYALVGLAIGFAMPTFAQEQNTVDPEVRQQIEAAYMKFAEAFNKHDAAAIAALYTEDAVQVWNYDNRGTASGQQAIEKRYADEIASSPGNLVEKFVQLYGIGDEITAVSEWSKGVWKGYKVRIYVRDLDTWKIRMEYAILSMIPR